jgi:hypothetical protein
MKNRDLFSSLFWLAFGAIFVIGGVLHGLMEVNSPERASGQTMCGDV